MQAHSRPSRVAVVLAAAALTACLVAAAAAPFAALTVTPHGSQVFDIMTGITTLPEGGSIVDQDTGVELHASRIEYREQEYVTAWGVQVAGSFGDVTAEELKLDLLAGTLSAKGALQLVRDALVVSAGTLSFDANAQVAVFAGGVEASAPHFTADRAFLDVTNGDVLLDGEYLFEGGFLTMQSPEGGGQLALRLVETDGVLAYDAATEPAPELLERFAPYL